MGRILQWISVGTLWLLSNLSFTCPIPMIIFHTILICPILGRITLRHYGRTCQPLTSNNPLNPLPPTKIGRNLQWISVGIMWLHCVVLLFLGFQRYFLQICFLTTTPTAHRCFVAVFSTMADNFLRIENSWSPFAWTMENLLKSPKIFNSKTQRWMEWISACIVGLGCTRRLEHMKHDFIEMT